MNTTFDALRYARNLENVGFTRQQAEVQAEAFKNFSDMQEQKHREETATKGDIALVRGELRETELRLQKEIEIVRSEIKSTELRLLKWQIGLGLALAAIMAKGFGWLGF